ncbi:MAG TPA: CHAT domain-containing protein, partial [Nocardioides sp.]|nr:CHAT domain-containing protein [Nocardioides sp.]
MANRSYLNFDLLLEQVGEDLYEARVTAAPVIDLPHVQFRLPFDDKGLKILLLELDPGRTDVRAVGGVQQRAAKEFGGPLFEAIFTGRLALAWTRSLDKVAAEKAGGLRLRLRISNEASDLAGLPWELLYDANGRAFPAQSEITPLVRFLDVTHEPDPIQVNGPLRVLAVISSPSNLPELDVEREWARIEAAMAAKVRQGLVVVDRLPEATVEELGEWLLNHDTHIIHFVGHGDFDPVGGEGFICFQNDRGGADPVTAAVLGPFIHDHDALRMVVINACRTARVSTDPYGGMAQGLVQQGATAVVAMQFPITDQAALMFTGKFYGALAAGLPVDQAVSYARKALQAKFRSEWATPVLFMRSPDGNIFQHVQAPPGWARHEPRGADTTGPDEIASTVPGPPVSDPAVADPAVVDPAVVDPAVADPAVAELDPTDLDVTDVIGPSATDIAREPRPWELPGAEPDPYQFLFEREPPEPEPP